MSPSPTPTVGRLVLVRHGESTFNAANRFTGWSDPELTPRGEAEARSVAERLRKMGVGVDAAFSSGFERTIRSLEIILEGLGSEAVPHADLALNERSYGELTGLDKHEAAARFGAEQVRHWRRSYADAPPGGESLRDTVARVAPYYLRAILPRALRGESVLVVAHGNTLRALVMALEGVSPFEVQSLEIATGEILDYAVAADATLRRVHPLEQPCVG